MTSTRSTLQNITENLDVVGFYKRMYGLIADHAERRVH